MIDASEIPLYQAVLYGIAEASLLGYVAAKETKNLISRIRTNVCNRNREMIASMINSLYHDDVTFSKAVALREMLLMAGDRKRAEIIDSFILANPEQFPEVDINEFISQMKLENQLS